MWLAGVCSKSLPAVEIWQCLAWLCLWSEPKHCASICCPISYSTLLRGNSHCVHQWACVLTITLHPLPHSCTLNSYPHPLLVSCLSFFASPTICFVNAVSVREALCYFQHSLQESIKPVWLEIALLNLLWESEEPGRGSTQHVCVLCSYARNHSHSAAVDLR